MRGLILVNHKYKSKKKGPRPFAWHAANKTSEFEPPDTMAPGSLRRLKATGNAATAKATINNMKTAVAEKPIAIAESSATLK